MKLYALHLYNTAHFPRLTLNTNDYNITVISGAQGTGKTSILRHLYHALTWFQGRYRDLRTPGVVMLNHEIYDQANASLLGITVKIPDALHQFAQTLNEQERLAKVYSWQLRRTQHPTNSISTVETAQLENLVKLYQQALKHDPDYGLPLIAYYPAERFINEVNLLSKNNPQVLQALHAYDLASIPYTTFSRFFEWLREIHDIENAHSARYLEQLSQIDLTDFQAEFQLKPLRPHLDALKRSLNIVLPEIEELILEYQPKIQLKVKLQGQVLLYQQLSNSLKIWIALVGDIVRRLCVLNPEQLDPCLVGEGILMIDQIEQQLDEQHCLEILPRLERAFPQLQIIASTSQADILAQSSRYQYLKLEQRQLEVVQSDAQILDEHYHDLYAHLLQSAEPLLAHPQEQYEHLLTQIQNALSPEQQQQLILDLQNGSQVTENLKIPDSH